MPTQQSQIYNLALNEAERNELLQVLEQCVTETRDEKRHTDSTQYRDKIDKYYLDMERELPIVRDGVVRLVKEGHTRFIFDLRTAKPGAAYPIVKWGALYGASSHMRRGQPESAAFAPGENIKLVGREEDLREIKLYRLDQIFTCFETMEEALEAFARADSE